MRAAGYLVLSFGIGHPPGLKVKLETFLERLERMADGMLGMQVRAHRAEDHRCHATFDLAATFPGKYPPDDGAVIAALHKINPAWAVGGYDCWYIGSKWKHQPAT